MMRLRRWDTTISDVASLVFKKHFDVGQGKFQVETLKNEVFEVTLPEDAGPYILVDEEHLTKYWCQKANTGWTFIVEQSDLPQYFSGLMDPEDYIHYVVATSDLCLEVLSKEPPIIELVPYTTSC